ncbi:hypothetical protein TWF694_010002 [Orbilia ellipsospora]|uniref:Uncharacterized protein n=1 Tax=Orbilia ellipsospora TaxID=2528407 RepID=A0AAV9XBP7_9PEZI
MSKPVIVVGIDFGTTYSGFSWARSTGTKEIQLVTTWPTTDFDYSSTHDKTRTWISYDKGNREPSSYGYEARGNPFKWFKVLLQHGHYSADIEYVQDANAKLKDLNKTIDNVISDYLKWIWQTGISDIRRVLGKSFESIYDLKVVLTVPAAWEPFARDRTKRAAWAAGLPKNLKLVSEPEAGALYSLLHREREKSLKVGDIFVVCDAGGGTVDLITYEVEALRPLKLKECAVGKGDLCGSLFLDIGFEQMIKRKIGAEKYVSLRERDKKDMISQFEYRVKRQFDGNINKKMSVTLRGLGSDVEDSDEDDDDLVHFRGWVFLDLCFREKLSPKLFKTQRSLDPILKRFSKKFARKQTG